ncbi:Tim10/DDP family zinc finger-domain-containing protein [Aspergillus pseudonomiae]|uniref:Mitochondrial import inner membrane translocase subunit n=1 Tax=Aspergillus pseudonomiae TaxID=1506151 RepID=A0A5N7DDV5_9EURO|nr:Tim10/DDP family zinc finger-domain-containing protein [Aspergillus pseudonomiae]KAB8257120.1 Tim10/DDP family zinc finger-domain-containing protein [Aspergillus pseudonomiae]KAE8404571.1 Tim10/DDP family zinc finger-domain-containing protein [Aspergillus pseudonomiae]
MALFGSGSNNASGNPQEVKTAIIKQLQQEAAMANARNLIGKVNEHCFDACIPTPGSSITPNEETCLSQCMEKYISFWNTASRTYVSRVSRESKRLGGAENLAMMATPTETSL